MVPELPAKEKFGAIAWQATMGNMIRWIDEGIEHPTSAHDNLKTMEMVFSAYDSAEQGLPIPVARM